MFPSSVDLVFRSLKFDGSIVDNLISTRRVCELAKIKNCQISYGAEFDRFAKLMAVKISRYIYL